MMRISLKFLFACLIGISLVAGSAVSAAASVERNKKPRVQQVQKNAKRVARAPKVVGRAVRPTRTVAKAMPTSADRDASAASDKTPALRSQVALVLDSETDQVLLSKNSDAVTPIASITKLMTAMVVLDAQQSLEDTLRVTTDDIDTEKGSSSRLQVGTELTRGEMLHLALMSSENRAANALGRNYPGGLDAFVRAMNVKAKLLGMNQTRYVEPTGLSSRNQSSAHDLSLLVGAASEYPLIREFSTTPDAQVSMGKRTVQFRNTNALVRSKAWDIAVQKTGYIAEAGRCLVMQAELAGRKLIMVLLDSQGKNTRIADAERIRTWLAAKQGPVVR
jgi:serine-type D-Ala-D-Ala endopeptidase (penicillin-binding protein 7)